jgi:hypothetical protein
MKRSVNVQFIGAGGGFDQTTAISFAIGLAAQKITARALIEKAELAGVDICPHFTTCLLCHQIHQQLTAISSRILTCSEIGDLLS